VRGPIVHALKQCREGVAFSHRESLTDVDIAVGLVKSERRSDACWDDRVVVHDRDGLGRGGVAILSAIQTVWGVQEFQVEAGLNGGW
jgi:hypothetical protein